MQVTFDDKEDFKAVRKAEQFAKDNGMIVGSMASDMPMGLADASVYDYVAKWYNIPNEDKRKLSGVIVGEKRNGPVTVVLFDEVDTFDNFPREY